jgi:hypothetical protein
VPLSKSSRGFETVSASMHLDRTLRTKINSNGKAETTTYLDADSAP